MTTKQKQWQLYFLDYYNGSIDGIWGQKSKAGTAEFQEDNELKPDGIYGSATEAESMEVVRAIQHAVGATEDGKAGPNTMAATKAWQQANGLPATGRADAATRAKIFGKPAADQPAASGNWWDEIQYFGRAEFRCKCGGKYCNGYPAEPAEAMVRVADKIRAHFGVPIKVSSGVRCKQHNANEGGAQSSQHLYGTAADLHVPGVSPKKVAAYAETLLPNTGGIGVYSWGVHIDTRGTKARWNG